jgi:hypothetical protein
MLTPQRLRQVLLYTPETGEFRWSKHRVGVPFGKIAGRVHAEGYRRIMIDGQFYAAGRLAWLYVYGVWPTPCIDHINGQRDDNRIVNLREVSRRVNQQNMRMHRDGHLQGTTRLKVPGLSKPWQARIYAQGKSKFLGVFCTESEAHEAYQKACNELKQECI